MRGVFKRTDNLVRIVGSHLSFVFFSFKGFSGFCATWKTKLIATTQLKMADWALIWIKFKSIASFTLRILQWFYPNFLFVFFLKGEMKARGFSGIPQRIVPRIMPDKTHRKQCNVGWTQTGRCKRTDPIQIFNPNLSLDRSTFDIRQPKLDASDKSIDESAVDCRLKKYYLVASPSATKPRRRSSSSASSCRPFRSFHHLPRQKKII